MMGGSVLDDDYFPPEQKDNRMILDEDNFVALENDDFH